MQRRWPILLGALALSAGTALATGGTTAMASATTRAATPSAVNPGGVAHPIGPASDVTGALEQEESTNWAGYADTAGTYTTVSASWTQPTGTCSSGDSYAAFWIGIDGYSSSSAEQTGTELVCVGKTAEYYAWYELYPGASVTYTNPVKAGDHITATVTWLSGEKFSLYIDDSTQGWSHTTDASLGSTPARTSAEVIVEAPCCTGSGGVLPLADFSSVTFTGATANGKPIGTPSLDPVQISMIDSTQRSQLTCTALAVDGEDFTCTWFRSN
jgi:peptidase A4-like protein